MFVNAETPTRARRRAKSCRRGGEARSVVGDVSTREGREGVCEQLSRLCGKIDCLVNNAGTNVRAPALEAEPRDYRRIMDVNLDAVYHLTVALQPFLAQSARLGHDPTIVNVASAAGVASTGSGAAYAMSKAGVVQLTKTLACEWARFGIRVNAVAPWVTWTPLLRDAVEGPGKEDQRLSLARAEHATPLARAAQPERWRAPSRSSRCRRPPTSPASAWRWTAACSPRGSRGRACRGESERFARRVTAVRLARCARGTRRDGSWKVPPRCSCIVMERSQGFDFILDYRVGTSARARARRIEHAASRRVAFY